MSPTKPTILIIPGSFSRYGAYDPFLTLLRAQDFTALAICLPSTQKRYPLPPATLQDDAVHVRGVVERLIAENEGTEVVILAHSYGGNVATEALAGLGVKDGAKGGVKRTVFLAASVPRVGETQVAAMRMEAAKNPMLTDTDGYMHTDPVVMAPFLCNDLPYAQSYECAVQLPHHSAISFQTPATQASYIDIPSTYIFCEKDMIIPPDAQQRFIETIEEVSGNKVDVKRLDSSHCPNWSQPQKLLDLLVGAALA